MITATWVSAIAMVAFVATAIVALAYAKGQVEQAVEANRATQRHARAAFLLELDRRWDSEAMITARALLEELRQELGETIGQAHPILDDANKAKKFSEEFAKKLSTTKKDKLSDYQALMRICGFFETVGLMVKRGDVPLEEIVPLFKGPILAVDVCYRLHIIARQKETDVPDGLYEHALYLADETKKLG